MGFVDAVKDFVGFGDIDYEEEMELEEYDEEPVEERTPLFSRKNKVVALDRASMQPSIVVLKPRCFNNTTEVADQIKQRRPVILDVGNLDPDEARRVVDFIAGTVYGLNGNMQKVAGGIFLATPAQVDIMGEVCEGKENGMEFSMF